MNSERVVILVSGGIDSATTLAVARKDGFDCYVLSFDYGQRHRVELDFCSRLVMALGAAKHLIFPLNLRLIGGSALTDNIDVPLDREQERMASEIPVTYVPARNTIFLSIALAWAEVLEASRIYIGANAIDYSGYPDCRPKFMSAFQNMANLATKEGIEGEGVTITAPLLDMTKAEIIRLGTKLGVDYALTISCYNPDDDGRSCGRCDSCVIRHHGFREAGVNDPTIYVKDPGV